MDVVEHYFGKILTLREEGRRGPPSESADLAVSSSPDHVIIFLSCLLGAGAGLEQLINSTVHQSIARNTLDININYTQSSLTVHCAVQYEW